MSMSTKNGTEWVRWNWTVRSLVATTPGSLVLSMYFLIAGTVQHADGTMAPVLIVRVVEAGVACTAGFLGGAIVTRMGRDRLRARSSGHLAAK